jgi:hypothetical protein
MGKLHSILSEDSKIQNNKQAYVSVVVHPILPFEKSEHSY